MFNRVLAIALNTFRESIRDRILFVVAVFALFIIGSSLFLGSISLDQDIKIIKDFGLTAIFLLQIFIIIFVGANLIYKEVERKTFFLILSKPIKKSEVIMGKCLGLSLTIFLMTALTSLMFFGVLFIKTGTLSGIPYLILAILLGFIEATLIIMISILFSGFTSPILSSVYTVSLFLIGHSSSVVLGIIDRQDNVIIKYIFSVLYYIFPNLEKFNIRNDVLYNSIPVFQTLALTVVYALAYGAALFLIAKFIFDRREY
ncbi:MAG: hypothetical protein A3A97_01680 [Candidatus Terrybacteria bacterium RIFCSPLOWO2_01_FULL_40_23]|uniref:ABC transporter permease n=1 Tax=Candidatus Terrybacteria bacterium RIFCSPLOWO2_01_FULL_40_23 TaxID=1802366 RepID=A0A1G2PR49_9BACT|nr:MAG: hypothetical protein A3A97_01680 [Candidatus Terrybacteria bacterium RIFCSPLOWO2_01_FULL_40_23]